MGNAAEARAAARAWVEANRERWPGLRAAHLVGGITSQPLDAPFPPEKDIDLHLIVAEESPALVGQGPFPPIVEVAVAGWPLEAGIKSAALYRSPEAVLANPEIAHHLTVDSVLYDPSGLVAALQAPVRAAYPRRQWVEARLAYERRGMAEATALRPMAAAAYGLSGEMSLLGYLVTFAVAAFGIAALGPPRIGGHALVHLRTILAAQGRGDLHEAVLRTMGVAVATPNEARAWLATAAGLFDRAVLTRRAPHPFQHKLHAHQRAYFVGACEEMIAAGYHREALSWAAAFLLAATDVLLADAPAEERPEAARQQAAFLTFLGLSEAGAIEERFASGLAVYDELFALAGAIAAANPAVID